MNTTKETFILAGSWDKSEFTMETKTARALRRIGALSQKFATNGAVIRNCEKIVDTFNEKNENSFIQCQFTELDKTSSWFQVEYFDEAGSGYIRFMMP